MESIALAAGGGSLLLLCCCLVLCCRRRSPKEGNQEPLMSFETSLTGYADQYEIPDIAIGFLREIGRGSFGTVTLCSWQGTDVAVKSREAWGEDDAESDQLYRTFAQEFRLMFGLRSPRIVQVFGICTTAPNQLKIVLEFASGGALRTRLDELERMPPKLTDALTWALDVALGMSYLHSRQVMHLDLKSANVLLDAGGRAKVADFGLAKAKEFAEENCPSFQYRVLANRPGGDCLNGTSSTLDAGHVGTPEWMAPEAIGGQRSFSSDVFSYGIILWEVSTSLRPWHGLGAVAIMYKVSAEQARLSVPEPIPESGEAEHPLAALMQHCWQQLEGDRPEFSDVARTMQEIVNRSSIIQALNDVETAQSPRTF